MACTARDSTVSVRVIDVMKFLWRRWGQAVVCVASGNDFRLSFFILSVQ